MRHQGHNRLTWSAGLHFDAIRLKLCGVTSPMMHSTLVELDRNIKQKNKIMFVFCQGPPGITEEMTMLRNAIFYNGAR